MIDEAPQVCPLGEEVRNSSGRQGLPGRPSRGNRDRENSAPRRLTLGKTSETLTA